MPRSLVSSLLLFNVIGLVGTKWQYQTSQMKQFELNEAVNAWPF